MRYVYMAIVVLFGLSIVIFLAQNIQVVTMSFLGFRARIPLALLAGVIYVAGALTGGGLAALLRQSFERSGMGGGK